MPLAHLTQLLDDPGGLPAHSGFHFVQRHPLGCAHHQTIWTDEEANGAPPAALEFIGHQRIVQARFAVGAWMAEINRVHHLAQ